MRGNSVLSCGPVMWSCSTVQASLVVLHDPCRPLLSYLGTPEPAMGCPVRSRTSHPARTVTMHHRCPDCQCRSKRINWTDLVVGLKDVGEELITKRTELHGTVIWHVKPGCQLRSDAIDLTYLGKRKSSRRSRPSPYPNFRSTVHVVSIRPC
jgi:RNA polymerase subunit RPABC4/transcription elongation factor Spt4